MDHEYKKKHMDILRKRKRILMDGHRQQLDIKISQTARKFQNKTQTQGHQTATTITKGHTHCWQQPVQPQPQKIQHDTYIITVRTQQYNKDKISHLLKQTQRLTRFYDTAKRNRKPQQEAKGRKQTGPPALQFADTDKKGYVKTFL